MKVVSDSILVKTEGRCDMQDLTDPVRQSISAHGLKDGTVTLFVPGSTAGLTTIEYESGLVRDFEEAVEKLAPSGRTYHHDARWGDGNGFSHVRASLLGPSLTVPFSGGRLCLGMWQQIVLVDFDNRSRSRTIHLQFIGE